MSLLPRWSDPDDLFTFQRPHIPELVGVGFFHEISIVIEQNRRVAVSHLQGRSCRVLMHGEVIAPVAMPKNIGDPLGFQSGEFPRPVKLLSAEG